MIERVELSLEYRENMEGVLSIQSVISYNKNDEEIKNYQDMVGREFCGEKPEEEAIEYVAQELEINTDIIQTNSEFVKTPWDK